MLMRGASLLKSLEVKAVNNEEGRVVITFVTFITILQFMYVKVLIPIGTEESQLENVLSHKGLP